ncbi:MAG: hypothetical protein F4X48_01525 [Acidimicrobiia bacterium]|nr:hypothetical protein [Acidimicrobiia bacterium]
MTKAKLIFLGSALTLVCLASVGTASAQDQTLTADPAAVPAPGTYDITVTASGFTATNINFAICNTGDINEIGTNIVELTAGVPQYCGGSFGTPINPASWENGTYTTTQSVEVTDAGVTFMMFELSATGEMAAVSVNVDETTTDNLLTTDDLLADTGNQTGLLAIIGGSIALAGLMIFSFSRRLRDIQ